MRLDSARPGVLCENVVVAHWRRVALSLTVELNWNSTRQLAARKFLADVPGEAPFSYSGPHWNLNTQVGLWRPGGAAPCSFVPGWKFAAVFGGPWGVRWSPWVDVAQLRRFADVVTTYEHRGLPEHGLVRLIPMAVVAQVRTFTAGLVEEFGRQLDLGVEMWS